MQHPTITQLERHGFKEAGYIGQDYFNNDIYEGDDILIVDDEIIATEEVTKQDLIDFLIRLGAEEKSAEK